MKMLILGLWAFSIFVTYKITYHYAFLDGEAYVANAIAERQVGDNNGK